MRDERIVVFAPGSRRTRTIATFPVSTVYQLAFEPSGARIVALLERTSPQRLSLDVIELATRKHQVVLKTQLVPFSRVSWAENGILFARADPRSRYGRIELLDPGTGRTSRVAGVGRGRDPAWSLGGTRIAVSTPKGIVVLDLRRGSVTLVTHGGIRDAQPTWSPDGRMLAYRHDIGDCYPKRIGMPPCDVEIFTVSLADGRRTNLTRTKGGTFEADPAWRPAGG
jgi:Tol biopolymer transport system component